MSVNTQTKDNTFVIYTQNLKLPEGHEPWSCFADLPLLQGKPPCHYPTKNGLYWDYHEQKHINVFKKAEYICVGILKKSRKGRRAYNIEYIWICSLDLDGKNTLEAVLKRLRKLNLPRCTIIKTSPGKFQLKWYLKTPVEPRGRPFKLWQCIQKSLGRAFKPFGVDLKPLLGITRLLRNEFAVNPLNTKYEPPHKVIVHQWGEMTDLDTLAEALSAAGWFYRGWKSLSESKEKLFRFFRKNPLWHGTQKRMSEITGIALRTLKLLLKSISGLLARKFTEQGGPNRAVAYRFKPVVIRDPKPLLIHKGHENISSKDLLHCFSLIPAVIEAFKSRKREKGVRISASFAATIALNVLAGGKITLNEACEQLRPGFERSTTGDNDFNYRQFCATVASGLRPDRKFRFSIKNLRAWGLI